MLRTIRKSRTDRKAIDALAGEILTRAGLPATRRNRRRYVDVAGPLDEPGTTLTVGGFEWLLTDRSARGQVNELVTRRLGPGWRSALSDDQADGANTADTAQYVRGAGLPDVVRFDPTAPGSQLRIPIGLDEAGEWLHLDLEQTPHVQVAGPTGYGRTSFLRLVAAWLAGHNANVTICDPKRCEFTNAFEGLPDITIWRDIDDIAATVRKFRESVEDYARATTRYGSTAALDEDLYPTRALLVDDLGGVLSLLRAKPTLLNRDRGYATDLHAVIDDLSYVTFVGRAYRHHVILASPWPTVLNTDIRDQLGTCIGIGPATPTMRALLFGTRDLEAPGAGRRGRALVGTRGDARPIQLAHITDTQATSLAMTGPVHGHGPEAR